MRPIRLATTATMMMMMTRIERDWVSDRGFRTAFGATASETGHLHPLNKRPVDVYYPDNIPADLEPAARKQAEEGGVPGARDSLLSVHQSVCKRKPAPDLIRGGNRFASRKPVKSGIWSPVSILSKRKRLRGRDRACFEIHVRADSAGGRGASCIVVSP